MPIRIRRPIACQLAYRLRREPLGRRTLMRQTGLSESVVRTELDKLQARGWARFDKAGTHLTEAGRQAFAPVFAAVRATAAPPLEGLALDSVHQAAQVRGVPCPSPWLQRDQAVRAGASGALLLVYRDGELRFADTDVPLARENPEPAAALCRAFPELQEHDLVLIAFAPQRAGAALGLWSMIAQLIPLNLKEV